MTPHVLRYKVEWTGFTGAPGYTNLYFNTSGDFFTPENVTEPVAKIDAWLNAWNSRLPATVNVKLSSTVETVRVVDGVLTDFDTIAPFARANGTGTGNYSAASGACVNWYTDGIRTGRRVRGRSFMVPIAGSALAINGSIDDAALSALRTANADLIVPTASGSRLYVWARPTPIKDPVTGKPTGGTNPDGLSFPVVSTTLPDKVAVLRSRRD